MFTEEKAKFYKNYILLFRTKSKLIDVLTINQAGEYVIQFNYQNDTGSYSLQYRLIDLRLETLVYHQDNISEIVSICILDKKKRKIVPAICYNCLGVFFNPIKLKYKKTCICDKCRDKEIADIIRKNKINNTKYIYLMKSSQTDLLKIGLSQNPAKRAKTLETGNGGNISIIGIIPGNAELEQLLHNKFIHYKIKGEWFSDNEEIRRYFANRQLGDII